ncbi:MAG: NADH-ubiquinone oxidoreductase-F iron-sulfur binding region domain-containing protein [Acidimicrobiales bacterium]
MTGTATEATRSAAPPAGRVPRLLGGLDGTAPRVELDAHLDRWGPLELPRNGGRILDEVEASGLVGHGGAWFPVAAKWRAVRSRRLRRPVVVVNGAEGEPASRKDALLLGRSPHLVLDGASAAASAVGAERIVVYVPAGAVPGVHRALQERRARRLGPANVEVVEAPDAFLAGQESAVVAVLNGRPDPVPSFAGLQTIRDRGVGGRPTLVQNAETLAHVALVARFGAQWFRALGTPEAPGTMLLTVSGRWNGPTVVEAPLGTPLDQVLGITRGEADRYLGVLLGGYGGTWVETDALFELRLDEGSTRRAGATLGAGVVALLPRGHCPLAEVANVVRYMDGQGAGQCGPCVNGLGELSAHLDALAFDRLDRRSHTVAAVLRLADLVEGRGACRHPDGVARFVRSACSVFTDEIAAHGRSGPCRAATGAAFLPVPAASRGVLRIPVGRR